MSNASIALFLVTSLLIILAPGQDMLLVISRSLARGTGAGVLTAAGVGTGLLGHTLLAALGLGTLLQASALAFDVMKYAGAAYMLYLGIKAFRAPPVDLARASMATGWGGALFFSGALSNLANPKVAVFYFAYLPQFVPAGDLHPTPTLLALGATFAWLTFLIKAPIGYFAGRLSTVMRGRPRIQVWLNRVCGSMMFAMGLRLALEGRAAR